MTQSIQIACGESECQLLPHIGGSIGGWRVGGQNMLRRAVADNDPLATSSFPLVPYSNRIASGCFDWAGERVSLPPHPIAYPHAIHGVGWQRAWEVTQSRTDAVHMALHHIADSGWPWSFYAEQIVSIGPDWLTIDMTARNDADHAVPLAFGHHLYFDCAGAQLQFSAQCIYPVGPDMLPMAPEELNSATNFTQGLPIASYALDNCFGKWDGKAQIAWDERDMVAHIESDLPHAVLYTPSGDDYFCFEPVPHISNALNRPEGDMPVISANELFRATIRLKAIPKV